MAERDDSWTIAPTLGWFVAFVAIGVLWRDGSVDAIADRMTERSRPDDTAAPVAGPAFAARPVEVADVDADADADDRDTAPPHAAGPAATSAGSGSGSAAARDSAHGAGNDTALEDTCLDPGATNGSAAPESCKRWAMDGFYRALVAEQAGKLGRPARVSWYGDSVIATDAIPGRLRNKLQGKFGDGGPGFVFLVAPHRFCAHQAIARSNTGGWTTHAISTVLAPDGWYGVGGASAETDGGGAAVKVLAGTVSNVELYYLAQPKGGVATLRAGDAEVVRADTRGDKAAGYAAGTISGGTNRLELATEGRVRVFGVDLENASGAVVDNLGVVSANVKSFANHDAAAWQGEIAHRSADLIMVMIGANEAEWLGPYDQDTKDYASHYATLLAPIRAGRPDAACLVVSPTDQAEAKDGGYPSRPVMPVLVAAQRKAARGAGCAFFSTYDWMGGKGSAARWFARGLVGSDFQHLSQRGANKLADAVYDAVLAGLDRYEHR